MSRKVGKGFAVGILAACAIGSGCSAQEQGETRMPLPTPEYKIYELETDTNILGAAILACNGLYFGGASDTSENELITGVISFDFGQESTATPQVKEKILDPLATEILLNAALSESDLSNTIVETNRHYRENDDELCLPLEEVGLTDDEFIEEFFENPEPAFSA